VPPRTCPRAHASVSVLAPTGPPYAPVHIRVRYCGPVCASSCCAPRADRSLGRACAGVQALQATLERYFKFRGADAFATALRVYNLVKKYREGKLCVGNWGFVKGAAQPVPDENDDDPDAPLITPNLMDWVRENFSGADEDLLNFILDILGGRASTGDLERMHKARVRTVLLLLCVCVCVCVCVGVLSLCVCVGGGGVGGRVGACG